MPETTYIRDDEHGVKRVGNSRVMLNSVISAFQQGHSPETIAQQYPVLSLEEVYGTITYYLANKAEVDQYLARQDEVWKREREKAEQAASPVVARLHNYAVKIGGVPHERTQFLAHDEMNCGILRRCCRSTIITFFCACVFLTLTASATDNRNEIREDKGDAADRDIELRWKRLKKAEAAEITRKHIHGLVRAAHLYHEAHGTLPPAVVRNDKLPAGKRLSGLVLLLPYLRAGSWLEKDKPCFDAEVVKHAADLYESIDLTKAWDDPVNLKAAKTVVPSFLAPQSGPIRDERGYAVTHFALVQGSAMGNDGAFPGETPVKFTDIKDGTVVTLAIGQIAHDLGPWMAEGLSTARQAIPPMNKNPGTFGSLYHKSGCYFATCDSSAFFVIFDQETIGVLEPLSSRAGGEVLLDEFPRYKNPFDR